MSVLNTEVSCQAVFWKFEVNRGELNRFFIIKQIKKP